MHSNGISNTGPSSIVPRSADNFMEAHKARLAQYEADLARAQPLFAQPPSCDPKVLAKQMRDVWLLSEDIYAEPMLWRTVKQGPPQHKIARSDALMSRMQLLRDAVCAAQPDTQSPLLIDQMQSHLAEGLGLLDVLLEKSRDLVFGGDTGLEGPRPEKAPGNMFSLCEILEDLRSELLHSSCSRHESLRHLAETLPSDPWAAMNELDARGRYAAMYLNAKSIYDQAMRKP